MKGRSAVGPGRPGWATGCAPYRCCVLAMCPLLKPGRMPDCMPPIIDMGLLGLWTLDIVGPDMAGRE